MKPVSTLKKAFVLILFISIYQITPLLGQRIMEPLGRGTIAIRQNNASVFVNWRIFSDEVNNDVTYNLYRNGEQIATGLNVSNYTDAINSNGTYQVSAVVDGTEKQKSPEVGVQSGQVKEFRINPRSQHYVHFAYPGDLDGDGEMDLVINRTPLAAGLNCYVEAYKLDGTHLWTVDMGPNSQDMDNIAGGSASINNGQHDGMAVYDLDGDGIAEVMIQSANGTKFSDGQTVVYSDNRQNFLSIVNGATGVEKARVALPDDFLNIGILQTQFSVGYFDGIHPSVVVKGKTRASNGWFYSLVATYDYDGTDATIRWKNTNIPGPEFHQYRMVDVDQDGKDEVCDGGYVLDDDGSLLYSMGNKGAVHGDRFHIGDFDPDRPGLEAYAIQQDNASGLAWYYYDAKDGSILQSQYQSFVADYARGNVADLDPNHKGYEMWTFTDGIYNVQDGKITNNITGSYPNFRLWWDGDEQSEMLDGVKFLNWNFNGDYEERVLTASQWGATTVARAAPVFYGDFLGDWREEVVYEKYDHSSILIFTTINPTDKRIYTLMQNPEYRLCLTTRGYYQSAQLDYYLGYDMPTPPTPAILRNELLWTGNASNQWNSTDNNWLNGMQEANFTPGDTVLFGIAGDSKSSIIVNEAINSGLTKVLSPVDYSFDGTGELSGDGGLIKSGDSRLTLNIDANYKGETRVEQGTLVINKNLSESTLKVYGGGILAGNGTVTKMAEFEKRAIITPGLSGETGLLTFASSLQISSGVICAFDLTDDSTSLVKPSDKINVGENVTVESGAIFRFNALNDEIKPGIYPLISYNGEISGSLSSIEIEGLFGKKYVLMDTLNSISLKIVGTREPSQIVWEGSDGKWDLQKTENWLYEGEKSQFVAGDTVIFNETGMDKHVVNVQGEIPIGQLRVEDDNSEYTFAGTGVIGGEGNLIKNDQGKLQMALVNNSYTGKTEINGGTFIARKLDVAGSASSIGANPSVQPNQFVINNAYFNYQSPFDSFTNKGIYLDGTSDTIEVSQGTTTLSIDGLLAGNAQLVKRGSGTLYLINKVNTYTGGTIIEGGTIQLNDPGAGQDVSSLGSGLITFKGGKLIMGNTRDYTDFNANIFVPEGYEGTLEADIRCNYGGKLTGKGTLNITLPGDIDRTIFRGDWSQFEGTVVVSGTSPMRLSGGSRYDKMTFFLQNGMAMYHSDGTSGGDSKASNIYIGSVTGSNIAYLRDENWIFGGANDTTTCPTKIEGYSVTKIGNGLLTLTNSNTYTGGTNINSGTLMVSNKIGSATGTGPVNVNNGGILAGQGSISGNVIVHSGGTLSPGEELGTLTVKNNVVLRDGSNLFIEVDAATNTTDQLNTGNYTLQLGGSLIIDNLSSDTQNLAEGDRFQIFTGTKINGNFTSIIPAEPGEGLAWDTSELNSNGSIKVTKATAINTLLADKFSIYPNPVNDIITISNPSNQSILSVKMLSLSGQTVLTKVGNLTKVNVTDIDPGVYVLEINTDMGKIVYPVTKR